MRDPLLRRNRAARAHHRRHRRPRRGAGRSLLASLLAVALTPAAPQALAMPESRSIPPPPTRVERFNPDEGVCDPRVIQAAFARHLEPWKDQPPAVLAQLRQVQGEMTRATLRRCVSKGLMAAPQAEALERQLGIAAAPAQPSPAPSQRP